MEIKMFALGALTFCATAGTLFAGRSIDDFDDLKFVVVGNAKIYTSERSIDARLREFESWKNKIFGVHSYTNFDSLVERIENLEKSLGRSRGNELEPRVDALGSDAKRSRQNFQDLTRRVEKLENDLRQPKPQNRDNVEQKIRSLESKIESLERALRNANSNNLESKIRALENKIDNLERSQRSNSNSNLERDVRSLQSKIDSLERSLRSASSNNYDREIRNLENKINSLERRNSELERDVSELKRKVR